MDDRQPGSALALLERAKSGDKEAFGALAEEHRAALQRLCFKMTGSQEEAEDLVQDTLLKAYTHIAEFELRASLKTWLFRIATNAALDHQRGKKPWDLEKRWQWFEENAELVDQMEQTLYLSPERSAEVKEVAATCVNCIAMSLPAKQRAAIVLCDQIGLSREEAAKSMGASVASVKTELHRARKTMTDVFEHKCALVDEGNQCDGCLAAGRWRSGRKREGGHSGRRGRGSKAPGDSKQKTASGKDDASLAMASGEACAQVEALQSDFIDDQLAAEARSGVELHVASCAKCAKSLRAMKRSVRFVRTNGRVEIVPRSPGGAYHEFTRAMSDPAYPRSPTETMLVELSRLDPELLNTLRKVQAGPAGTRKEGV